MSTLRKKVVSDSLFLTIGDLMLRVRGIIFIPFILKFISLEDYGAFIQIMVNNQLVTPIATLAMGLGFLRYTSRYDDNELEKISRDYWSVFVVTLFFSFVGAAVIYFSAPIITEKILHGTGLASLQLSALLVFTGCISYQNGKFLSSRKKMKLYSIYQIVEGLLPYFGMIYGISRSGSLLEGMWFFLITDVFIVAAMMIWIVSKLKFIGPTWEVSKQFIVYSWPLIFSQISGGLLSKLDRYFIGYYLGPAAIGIYNIVYSACSILQGFTVPFIKYFGAYMSKVWDDGDHMRVINQLKEGMTYYLCIAMGGLIALTFFLKPAVDLFLKHRLDRINHFEWLIFVTGLGIVLFGASNFFTQLIKYREQNYYQLLFQFLSLIVNAILNVLWIKKYGIIGAGWATFLSYLFLMILCNIYSSMALDRKFILKMLALSAATTISVAWYFFVGMKGPSGYFISEIGGMVLYGICIFMFGILNLKTLRTRFNL